MVEFGLFRKKAKPAKSAGKAILKGSPLEELNRLKRWYAEELRRKDRIIDELKQSNDLLMKTALKRSAEQQKLKMLIDELNRKLEPRK